jgi:hypothetical protein
VSGLQQQLELSHFTALHEKGVGIMALGQYDAASGNALLPKSISEPLRGLLPTAIYIRIEGEINGSHAFAQLPELAAIEMVAQGASNVAKAGLPQHGVVEQSLDENHLRTVPH